VGEKSTYKKSSEGIIWWRTAKINWGGKESGGTLKKEGRKRSQKVKGTPLLCCCRDRLGRRLIGGQWEGGQGHPKKSRYTPLQIASGKILGRKGVG